MLLSLPFLFCCQTFIGNILWTFSVFISHIHSDMFHFLLYGCFRPAIPPQFPDLTCADGAVDDGIPVLSFVPPRNGTKLDSRVLEFCYPKARKVAEIAEYLGVKDSTYLRKKYWEILNNKDIWTKVRYPELCIIRPCRIWCEKISSSPTFWGICLFSLRDKRRSQLMSAPPSIMKSFQ